MALLLEPPLSTSLFSNNSSSYSQTQSPLHFKLLRTNFSSTPKFEQTVLIRQYSTSRYTSKVCAAAIDPPPPPDQNQSPLRDAKVSLEVASTTRDRQKIVRVAWEKLVRWSRSWRSKAKTDVLERTNKVVVLGGGSFGTAMASHVAGRKAQMEVIMLFSCSFLEGVADYVEPGLPFISLSKGLELNTLRMMSQIIPQTLRNSRQPYVALSGPSFALELMNKLPTAMVVASKDKKLANTVQQLLASRNLRINTTSDVIGVEIAGALKNVLAIAAGIVEGLNLGNNSMAALVAQGCSEIRWLSTKMGAKSTTISGLSGTGDIMLTCFVSLSRNRTVGVRLGSGETLDDILCSMNQVAEGVSTAGAVIALGQKYNVKMPVLTAVARIIDNELTPQKAVFELMNLPQVEEV
ncbi:glycerol-3-phosphate dehydrogenase [NAD(+)] 2, chloroplastic isoform X2 [Cynara cardunculus var. scolymus]|uniref:glycerol-3-phosphate dehydrogenase [NAD(+)] 2, chloroplastic isoform X2 n=1 Tax=Cynara cardunculus var. scolymus TaxID=59895 RepID=UPI000D62E7B7|nr:glycerol-3-phosphate dehydrogenase [NAD(+)] 2, chloroplastic isoform X2 [Cynara cardunculus var. scolymus]